MNIYQLFIKSLQAMELLSLPLNFCFYKVEKFVALTLVTQTSQIY